MSNLLKSLSEMTKRPYVMEKDMHANYIFGASQFNGRIVVKFDPESRRECSLDKLILDFIDYLHDQDNLGEECEFTSIKNTKEKGVVVERSSVSDCKTHIKITTVIVESNSFGISSIKGIEVLNNKGEVIFSKGEI